MQITPRGLEPAQTPSPFASVRERKYEPSVATLASVFAQPQPQGQTQIQPQAPVAAPSVRDTPMPDAVSLPSTSQPARNHSPPERDRPPATTADSARIREAAADA